MYADTEENSFLVRRILKLMWQTDPELKLLVENLVAMRGIDGCVQET